MLSSRREVQDGSVQRMIVRSRWLPRHKVWIMYLMMHILAVLGL